MLPRPGGVALFTCAGLEGETAKGHLEKLCFL